MQIKYSKYLFPLIVLLSITPFILFLGKNYLYLEFFTIRYFLFASFYCLFFICVALVSYFYSKKTLIFILFFAYFGFFQFYYVDIQNFFSMYINTSRGIYVLSFLLFISFIVTITSSSSIFRNFVFIFLFLNIALSVNNLIPALGAFLKTSNTIESSSNIKNFTSVKYPNIFYIVPDELASPKILKDYVDIDFKDSIKKFEEKGFVVPNHKYSSYNASHLALATLFEMDYPATENSNYKYRNKFYPSIRDNNPPLLQYLNKYNYKFIIIPPSNIKCPKSKKYMCITPDSNSKYIQFFQDYSVKNLLKNSLTKRILDNHTKLYSDNQRDDSAITL